MSARQEGEIGINIDFSVRKAHTLGTYTVTWTDENEDPIDLTGYTFQSFIDGSEEVFDVAISDASAGQFTVGMDTVATDALIEDTNYRYLISVDTGDAVIPLFYGKLFVLEGLE